ncbi:CPBP family intramembrane glutamic endopeptidase [Peribacillus sp. SCS-155]|uniref:CPBP family intramembrane glutamic endopeptidase n=1 Tax=Peribacillus sedimenti TaxID=3115297 RepID=UPI003905808A
MNRIDLKLSLLLAAVCAIGAVILVPYQLGNISAEVREEIPLTTGQLTGITALQMIVTGFILSFIGFKLVRRTGLTVDILQSLFLKEDKTKFQKNGLIASIAGGIMFAFFTVAADRFYFADKIEKLGEGDVHFSFQGLLAGILYGGVFEEVMLRLFFMSLLVWILKNLFARKKDEIPAAIYWSAITVAAVLFAAGHLPATEALFGDLTATMIARSFLLNGLGGILFGYLYWKKGLEYSMIAHMFCHIGMQVLFIPLLY